MRLCLTRIACALLMSGVAATTVQPTRAQQAGANPAGGSGQSAGQDSTPTTDPHWMLGGLNQSPWFANQAISQELNLTDKQLNQLKDTYGQAWNQYHDKMSQLPGDLDETQQQAKKQQLQVEMSNNFASAHPQIFSDSSQQARFNQLSLQYQGPNAYNHPAVQQQLKLTPQQLQQASQVAKQWQAGAGAARSSSSNSDETNWSRFQKETNESINRVLTPQQQQTWQQMRGKEFSMPQASYFPPAQSGGAGN